MGFECRRLFEFEWVGWGWGWPLIRGWALIRINTVVTTKFESARIYSFREVLVAVAVRVT